MSRSILRAAGALASALCFAAGIASAQAPAVSPKEAEQAKAEQNREVLQPLNNAPVWKEIRSGEPQITTVTGRETNNLIQTQGQTWRAVSRADSCSAGACCSRWRSSGSACSMCCAARWRLSIEPGDRYIERFSPADRYAHWLVAITWVTLAITGLILSLGKSVLLPLIGYTLFSWLAILAKNIHNFIGPILIIGVPWLFLRFIRDNGIGADDVRWFVNIVGYFKGHEHPSGRFNAGEKLVFWFVLVIFSITLIVTGLILVFPNFNQTRSTMQVTNVIHMTAAYLSIALACVHIYLGTIGMEGAYRAMRYGYVDESWAKHHHLRWYEQIVAGKSPQKFVKPEVVPPEAAPPRPAAMRRA